MLCDVALHGEVRLPPSQLDAFLCAEMEQATLPGFPREALMLFPRTVEAALEELSTWPVLAPEYLHVALEGVSWSVRGLVSKDTFLALAPGLTSMCRTAARHGGGGRLTLVGLNEHHFGYQSHLAFGRATVRALSAGELFILRVSPQVAALRQAARACLQGLLGDGAGVPFTGA